MTIQDLLDMGYDTNAEIVIHDYDTGDLYNLNVESYSKKLEKLIVLYYDGMYE